MDSILKRTDFAVPRQCRAQIGNAFSIEPSVNGKQKEGGSAYLGLSRNIFAYPLNGPVRYTGAVVL